MTSSLLFSSGFKMPLTLKTGGAVLRWPLQAELGGTVASYWFQLFTPSLVALLFVR